MFLANKSLSIVAGSVLRELKYFDNRIKHIIGYKTFAGGNWLCQELKKCKSSFVHLSDEKLIIFIFLSQVSLRSVSGQYQVSLRP